MRLTWINGAFPRGRCAPRRSSGLGATADQALQAARDLQETSRGCDEKEVEERGRGKMEKKEVEDDSDDDDNEDDATTLLHGWHSQKAAPLVVRVIDDRENMRARKKGPPRLPGGNNDGLSARPPCAIVLCCGMIEAESGRQTAIRERPGPMLYLRASITSSGPLLYFNLHSLGTQRKGETTFRQLIIRDEGSLAGGSGDMLGM
ncbi:hypothetical protein ALC53_04456 [Atta colombica]|uniref:Uncharacterized protein n=1 Tax=Atta colombica TaxID=520822 RepID=A0A195BK80_9HYME|nr:hypothetical protein ALC53_04456 [Atta colombica]